MALVESPTGAYRWFNATLIEREMQNPTDTHGLDQAPPPSLAPPAPPQHRESSGEDPQQDEEEVDEEDRAEFFTDYNTDSEELSE